MCEKWEGEAGARRGQLQFGDQGMCVAKSQPEAVGDLLRTPLCEKRTAKLEPDTTSLALDPATESERTEGEGRARRDPLQSGDQGKREAKTAHCEKGAAKLEPDATSLVLNPPNVCKMTEGEAVARRDQLQSGDQGMCVAKSRRSIRGYRFTPKEVTPAADRVAKEASYAAAVAAAADAMVSIAPAPASASIFGAAAPGAQGADSLQNSECTSQ